MIVLRVSTEGALLSGFPDVFWGLGRMLPNKRSEGTAGAVPSRFASVYKHLPCLPVVRPSFSSEKRHSARPYFVLILSSFSSIGSAPSQMKKNVPMARTRSMGTPVR